MWEGNALKNRSMEIKMFNYMIRKLILILTPTLLISCSGGKMEEKPKQYNAFKDISSSSWTKLSKKKIYFGHQSVGFNIIDGVKDLMKENNEIKLNIKETSNRADFESGILAHSRVGKNTEPKSKIDNFAELMDNGIGNTADIAFLKFCYVDVNGKTDVKKVFEEYKNKMKELEKKYPKTTFIHLSVPLRTTKENLRTKLKKLFGSTDIWEYNENKNRNALNDLLAKEYAQSGKFFDIAGIESTYPDNKRATFTCENKTYYTMVPEYTYDGGHLNETGRKKIAEQLLFLLINTD